MGSYNFSFETQALIFLYMFILRVMQDRRFPPEWAILQPSESPTFLLPSRVLAPSKYLVENRKERRPHQNLTKANSFEKKNHFFLG